jgi:hypothetical protein
MQTQYKGEDLKGLRGQWWRERRKKRYTETCCKEIDIVQVVKISVVYGGTEGYGGLCFTTQR